MGRASSRKRERRHTALGLAALREGLDPVGELCPVCARMVTAECATAALLNGGLGVMVVGHWACVDEVAKVMERRSGATIPRY